MSDLLQFLRRHPRAWILPIVIFFALLVALAWFSMKVPENPFAYSEY